MLRATTILTAVRTDDCFVFQAKSCGSLRNGARLLALTVILATTPPTTANDAELHALEAVTNVGGTWLRGEMVPGHPVVAINLSGTKFTDTDVHKLSALPHLQMLDLSLTKVTDAGLQELVALKELNTLNLATKLTDTGLKALAALNTLQTLELADTNVTDAGLSEVAAVKRLEVLDLRSRG